MTCWYILMYCCIPVFLGFFGVFFFPDCRDICSLVSNTVLFVIQGWCTAFMMQDTLMQINLHCTVSQSSSYCCLSSGKFTLSTRAYSLSFVPCPPPMGQMSVADDTNNRTCVQPYVSDRTCVPYTTELKTV